jgi:hypothetical protein
MSNKKKERGVISIVEPWFLNEPGYIQHWIYWCVWPGFFFPSDLRISAELGDLLLVMSCAGTQFSLRVVKQPVLLHVLCPLLIPCCLERVKNTFSWMYFYF